MTDASIDVIIPTFNGWRLTESCLRHLEAQTIPHHLIVADNGSTDGTPDRVRERSGEVEVVALSENRGFSAACNTGAVAGCGAIVVLLNNDVDAEPEFLERLVAPLVADERVGSVAPLLVRPGREMIDSVGLAADPTLAGFPRHQGRPVRDAGRSEPTLLGPSGGAAAYRRAAWEALGGLDERIFLYQEDLDLALRLRGAGWEAASAPTAVGVHLGSATTGRRSSPQRARAASSRGYLLRRYGVLRSAAGPRALLTEAVIAMADLVICRDLAAARGRLRGWRAAREVPRLPMPSAGIDRGITLRESLRLRWLDYGVATTAGAVNTAS